MNKEVVQIVKALMVFSGLVFVSTVFGADNPIKDVADGFWALWDYQTITIIASIGMTISLISGLMGFLQWKTVGTIIVAIFVIFAVPTIVKLVAGWAGATA